MVNSLTLNHGQLILPVFLPDATFGAVRSVDSRDLAEAGITALVMNVFHLMQRPGSSTIAVLGGLHRMAAWNGPIVTDSGGFQAYSLIRNNPKQGRISDQGLTFQPEGAERRFQLTPEKSIQLQLSYGADIVICLDDCTHVTDSPTEQRRSVERTIRWARRCRDEFDRQLERQKRFTQPPLLFAVVQGGGDLTLRAECAAALLEIGFDGFGFGGWPLDDQGQLLSEILAFTRAQIPARFPMHALGVGHPVSVVTCARMGYDIFDSALPTRDARQGRLLAFTADPQRPGFQLAGDWFTYVYLPDRKHIKADTTISPGCTCFTCRHYSLGYLHHLHKLGETLALRLATIHNLHFMARVMDLIRRERETLHDHSTRDKAGRTDGNRAGERPLSFD
ncbi:tRNA guanosine(34) transglycosylase Tgt [uncultured Chloroflexus sp.]|uniref:tRNA-ribosyltransferase family protein n=1 Tax=uncultured Chloroflexus sp. TaxID=214040 RepID=UPI002603CB7E|nr:tRNA guanosine(34) transglycosylase Tgt [uncultured Chloroflexus sp.]